jgi:hypothetical protein
VYRIVEKANFGRIFLLSYLFFITGSLLYLNEKAIVRRRIERVKDVSECFFLIHSQAKGKAGKDAKEQQGIGYTSRAGNRFIKKPASKTFGLAPLAQVALSYVEKPRINDARASA